MGSPIKNRCVAQTSQCDVCDCIKKVVAIKRLIFVIICLFQIHYAMLQTWSPIESSIGRNAFLCWAGLAPHLVRNHPRMADLSYAKSFLTTLP
jgi:hypothetical protein